MITTFIRYDMETLKDLITRNKAVRFQGHRIELLCRLTKINGQTMVNVLKESSEAQYFETDEYGHACVRVGVSLSHLTMEECRKMIDHKKILFTNMYSVPGCVYEATGNKHLWLETTPAGNVALVFNETGEAMVGRPERKLPDNDELLNELIANHDSYYQYSDDISAYRRGDDQRKAIVARIEALGFNGDEEYRKIKFPR